MDDPLGMGKVNRSDEFSEKFQKGGGHFQSKNLYCKIWTFKQGFFSMKVIQKGLLGYVFTLLPCWTFVLHASHGKWDHKIHKCSSIWTYALLSQFCREKRNVTFRKWGGGGIPDICHRRDRRRLWRKIVHVEKFSPWHVVKWKISPHDKCGETLSHGEISPHYKCGENLSSGKFLHMRKVEKICHVEKFLLMRDVEKICQVGFK